MRFIKRKVHGFTLAELLVSMFILIIISIAVAGDVNRTQYQTELNESARLIAAELRNLQTRAFAATAVQTCMSGTVRRVCEYNTSGCDVAGVCDQPFPPYAVGAEFSLNATSSRKFAEADPTLENRRNDTLALNREDLGILKFHSGSRGTVGAVTVLSLTTTVAVNPVTVVFERQTGKMRINACGNPPGAPVCGGAEPTVLTIVIRHSKTTRTKTIRLNAITGKISID